MFKVSSIIHLIVLFVLSECASAQQPITRIDIFSGVASSDPSEITSIDSYVYFRALDSATGYEPRISDGTVTGTRLVKDINPGPASSTPTFFRKHDGKVYFSAYDSNGHELWVTDGTANGTKMVKDIFPGSRSSNPSQLYSGLGKLFFMANDGINWNALWVTDGTENGTIKVKDIDKSVQNYFYIESMCEYNGKIYFNANDSTHGNELWATDGTENGTYLVKDILPGTSSGLQNFFSFTPYKNKLYFVGSSKESDYLTIMSTDGTETGTVMVFDPVPGATRNQGPNTTLYLFNNLLLFGVDSVGPNNTSNIQLWISDGTANGSKKIKQFGYGNGINSGGISRFEKLNNILYFTANDSSVGREIFITDGTENGTKLLKDIKTDYKISGDITDIATYKNRIYFGARDSPTPSSVWDLWISDGTESGTQKLLPYNKTVKSGLTNQSHLTSSMAGVFVNAKFDTTGHELWVIKDTSIVSNIAQNESQIDIYFKLYPNPAHKVVNVNFSPNLVDKRLTVTDISGKQMIQHEIKNTINFYALSTLNLPEGIYIVTLYHSKGKIAEKVTIYK